MDARTPVPSLAPSTLAAEDRWRLDFENGAAVSGYNDVRIPGNSGTKFSMTDDLTSGTEYFWRVRADFRFAPKHVLSGLAAPLTINSSGAFSGPVDFAGTTFAQNLPTDGTWTFNSYRVTYRYEPVRRDTVTFGFGATLKVRDAVIRLRQGSTTKPTSASSRSSTSSSNAGWATRHLCSSRETPWPPLKGAPRTSSRASRWMLAAAGLSRRGTVSSRVERTTTRCTPSPPYTTSPPA